MWLLWLFLFSASSLCSNCSRAFLCSSLNLLSSFSPSWTIFFLSTASSQITIFPSTVPDFTLLSNYPCFLSLPSILSASHSCAFLILPSSYDCFCLWTLAHICWSSPLIPWSIILHALAHPALLPPLSIRLLFSHFTFRYLCSLSAVHHFNLGTSSLRESCKSNCSRLEQHGLQHRPTIRRLWVRIPGVAGPVSVCVYVCMLHVWLHRDEMVE